MLAKQMFQSSIDPKADRYWLIVSASAGQASSNPRSTRKPIATLAESRQAGADKFQSSIDPKADRYVSGEIAGIDNGSNP